MLRTLAMLSCGGAVVLLAACGSDPGSLFEPKPECQGESIAPFAGQHQQLISFLEIGKLADGFDLDGDGNPDNKLAGVGGLAAQPIADGLAAYDLMIPLEMFDYAAGGVDDCVKFALYLGTYKTDIDLDGRDSAVEGGDCNDHDENVSPRLAEVADNGKDDDCDGLADEAADNTPSTSTADADQDGVTIAQGDCDDTNNMVRGPGFAEICGDGFDNDCDGVADRTTDINGVVTACNPYDDSPDSILIDPRSFDGAGKPLISFTSGETKMVDGKLQLSAGPSLFQVSVPVTDGIELTLKITGTTIEADVESAGGRVVLRNGRLGGVIDARTADTIRGLEVSQIGLTPEDSLLDAIFGNVLGNLLALPTVPPPPEYPDVRCPTPDIDVDRDGLEAFCDTNSDNDPNTKVVDLCIDGDGTIVRDEVVNGVVKHCTEALDDKGKPRFVDGISVELNFDTAPADLVQP